MAATVLAVAILAFLWKFGFEEMIDPLLPGIHDQESAAERWEFVIVSTLLAGLAMLLPGIAAYRQINQRLQADRVAAAVFATAPQPMLVMDADRRIEMVNPAFAELTGIRPEQARGEALALLESDLQRKGLFARIDTDLTDLGSWSGELWVRRPDGSPYAVWLSLTSVRDADGEIASLVGVLTDITWRKQREEAAIYDATHDALTGLPNRRLFMERLHQVLGAAKVGGDQLAVLFADLDGFKEVNDTLGHAAGDEVLRQAAERLGSCARSGDVLARLGGDEFVMLLREVTSLDAAESVARRCLERLAEPWLVAGNPVKLGASIGIAAYPQHAESAELLLQRADSAMYEVKRRGRNGAFVWRLKSDDEGR